MKTIDETVETPEVEETETPECMIDLANACTALLDDIDKFTTSTKKKSAGRRIRRQMTAIKKLYKAVKAVTMEA